MCISATMLAAIGTAAAGVGSVYAATQAGKGQTDPAAAQAKIDATAAQSANARLAMRKRALAANSLATGAGDATAGSAASGVMGGGKATLGG